MRTTRNELYHSDTYLGQDYSDGIRHWKYIKREKKNGKWVYYYKDDKLNDLKEKKEYNLKALQAENVKRKYGNDTKSWMKKNGKDVGRDIVYQKLSNDAASSTLRYTIEKERSDRRKRKIDKVIKTLNNLSLASHRVKKAINKGMKKLKKLWYSPGKVTTTSSSSMINYR